jgi:heat shock protein HslJ
MKTIDSMRSRRVSGALLFAFILGLSQLAIARNANIPFERPRFDTCHTSATESDSGAGLTSTEWVLDAITRGGAAVEIPSGVAIRAKFAEGRVTGRAVCNNYFATFTAADAKITVGDVGATKMFCGAHADLETVYFDLLRGSESFSIEDGRLTLTGPKGSMGFSKRS